MSAGRVQVQGETDVLIAVDVQPDFMPGGALPVPEGDAVVPVINFLLRQVFVHTIATQDWHPADHASFAHQHHGEKPFDTITMPYGDQTLWPPHCVQGTVGAAIDPRLDNAKIELVIRKGYRRAIDSYSAFRENDRVTTTGLDGYLKERGFRRVFVAGLARGYCTDFTAEDAADLGYEVFLITDACRGLSEAVTEAATKRLAAKNVQFIRSEDLLPAT